MTSSHQNLRGLAALATVAVITAGCGSAAAGNTSANRQQAVKFAECMRSNGVGNFPDPNASGAFTIDAVANGSGLNTNSPAFNQAMTACKNLEPAGFTGTKRTAQQQAAALKFAQCMRKNGVPSFPDPAANGPIIDVQGAHSIPGFQAAVQTCRARASS
jgi:hypothetical protein